MNTAERRPAEKFIHYKLRLKIQKQMERARRPNVLWPSAERGTYIRKIHGPLR